MSHLRSVEPYLGLIFLLRFVSALGVLDINTPTGPTLFRTYDDIPRNKSHNCKIWEAVRATSAAPTFFKRINIGDPGLEVGYVDAGMGYNNPTRLVRAEAKLIFGETSQVCCVVSIGTGQTGAKKFDKPGFFQKMVPTQLAKALGEIATDSGKTAKEMSDDFINTPGVYFRFDVDRGLDAISLDEWTSLGDVEFHTKNYLKGDASLKIDEAVKVLLGESSNPTYEVRYLGSQ